MTKYHEENPGKVKDAEIVVAIPSHNGTAGITVPTTIVDEGLVEFFPDRTSVIVTCDSESNHGTRQAFFGMKTAVPKIYISSPAPVRGKGNNLRNLFRKAVELNAQAVIIVNEEKSNITPRWIKNLGDPLFANFGFVSPLYLRHRFEGSLARILAYPLTRSLYGRRVREPMGGDVGFSGRLARLFLEETLWDDRISQFGIDIWMTTLAMTQEVPICQSFMGRPTGQTSEDPAADLGILFNQVAGTIFKMMDCHTSRWKPVKWSKPTAISGFGQGDMETIPDISIQKGRLYARFTEGLENLMDRWKTVLTQEVFSKLTEVSDIVAERFDFPTELWAKVIFDYATAFRREGNGVEQLLDSLQPLYYGKVLSYINKVETMSIQQAEEYVEEQCLVFEETKPYLLSSWADG
jgi:hypothetical protein